MNRSPVSPRTILLIAAALLVLTAGARAGDPSGHWEGAIVLPNGELVIRVDLSLSGDQWAGTIDIPAQGAAGLPLTAVRVSADSVAFAIAHIPGDPAFRGVMGADGIRGDFVQWGQTLPFHLGRETLPAPRRPQEPQEPFPYRAEDVTYKSGQIQLAGTLTLPPGEGPFPAVLLVSGSGPQNRNEEVFQHKPFLVLADFLTRGGMAVLRVDDRGVGGSGGSLATATTLELTEDALAGVRFLSRRRDIDPRRIGLIGHSEGGIIAPLAARQTRDVAFVVLLAGTGVPGRAVLMRQLALIMRADGATEETIATVTEAQRDLIDAVVSDAPPADQRAAAARLLDAQADSAPGRAALDEEARAAQIDALLQQFSSPWLRYFLVYDPRPALRALEVPVLVMAGCRDLQVDPEQNLPEIRRALEEAPTQDVTVECLPDLNHLFQTAATGSPSEYVAIDETISPLALGMIRAWIAARFLP
jgi:dienelactone hydrolase